MGRRNNRPAVRGSNVYFDRLGIILNNFKRNFARNFVKKWNSGMNSLKCPKSLTELLPIYQNKHWTIRQWDNCYVDPLSHRIILKIVGFLLFILCKNNCVETKDILYINGGELSLLVQCKTFTFGLGLTYETKLYILYVRLHNLLLITRRS